MANIKLHEGQTQAPYVPRVPVVVQPVGIRVEPLRTHVRACADVRAARVKRATHDPTNPEIGYLHFVFAIDEQVRGLDISVDDLMGVEVAQSFEHLFRYVR